MKYIDTNLTWVPPAEDHGFRFVSARSEGAFLRLEYRKIIFNGDVPIGRGIVNVFLNDMGREVGRTEDVEWIEDDKKPATVYTSLSLWKQFVLWFQILISDIREIVKCKR